LLVAENSLEQFNDKMRSDNTFIRYSNYVILNWLMQMKPMKVIFVIIAGLIILLAGCSKPTQSANPAWVDKLIKQYESDPVGNPPQSIWSYDYNGQTAYFVPAQCCDQYSTLYDANGVVICAPDGGFSGKGDGKCADFVSKSSNGQLIWEDTRTR
jgi:hypothetical protein